MLACHFGRNFQVTVAGGSYQEGLTSIIHGNPPGMSITEQEIYGDLLLRKPGVDELSSPRKEPDLPVIYSGINVEDTVPDAGNKNHTNGTPLVILIPNLDRHFKHIKEYQDTNRTPRPGHASYATFQKYGPDDDAIGAGFFSGRYTSTIVAAGCIAKKILKKCGIDVFAYIKELASVHCPDVTHEKVKKSSDQYKKFRRDYDPFYQQIYNDGRINMDMRFLEKMKVLAKVEQQINQIQQKAPKINPDEIKDQYGIHHILNCPDIDAADEMTNACNKISAQGDSAGGLVEVIVTGAPPGLGEPVFAKLDAELGRMLGIGAVKAVEVGAGIAVKDMTGSQSNDQMKAENGKVKFQSNNAGGVTGGISTGQSIIARITIKPTPTIAIPQKTIDKYTLENKTLEAITRRDATIVARIWPVAENYTAIAILDLLMTHFGYQTLKNKIKQ